MKKIYLLIALAMVAGMTVSCKNHKKAEADVATEEVVEAAKTILTDDVLATLDKIANEAMFDENKKGIIVSQIIASNLTEEDKLVKPDYLLDPSAVDDLVTKSQKIGALAILKTERPIREIYGMPVELVDEAIARLAAEVNIPTINDPNKSAKEKAIEQYERFKDNGELGLFWQYCLDVQNEIVYIMAQDPDLFMDNITEEQSDSYFKQFGSALDAVEILAKYDEEIAIILDTFNENRVSVNDEEATEKYSSKESVRQQLIESKDKFIARRNNLLK